MPEENEQNSPEYSDAYRKRVEEMQKRQQRESEMRKILKQVLDTSAFERLQNIKLSNPELFERVAQLLIMLYQQGKLKNVVDEKTLKALLSKLLENKRDTTITFNRK